MKPIHWLVAVALAVAVGFVAAQTVVPMPVPAEPAQALPTTPPPPVPPVTPETPAPIVVETKVDLTSGPGPQLDPTLNGNNSSVYDVAVSKSANPTSLTTAVAGRVMACLCSSEMTVA